MLGVSSLHNGEFIGIQNIFKIVLNSRKIGMW